jgi:hypothetical protein
VGSKPRQDAIAVKQVIHSFPILNKDKIHITYNKTNERRHYSLQSPQQQKVLDGMLDVSEGEYSTIQRLHDYCVDMRNQNKSSYVFYIHNKGNQS